MEFLVTGFKARWPLSTTFRSQSSKVASVKKHVVSTSLVWVKRLALIPIQSKPTSHVQTTSFLRESRTRSLHALTADTEITQNKTVTSESPKSTMQSRLANLR